ncbi:GNAT family N-acetyltransferase [Coprothermobacter platensis]|uniref:GNAT family N-acetyltransferase n=1 Tax=Coprothermobacter platensis TaxID=108819 RepID=UPI000378560E|nr:GNAT family protein [Coprothermobacter platensis]
MLSGHFVRLRAYEREDLEKARAIYNDPEVNMYLRPDIPFPLKAEDEIRWYESQNPYGSGSYSFAIERLEDRQYLGSCGIDTVDWKNSHASVGLFLDKLYWNKGYGTDALSTLVDFCFQEMNLHKVYLYVFAYNQRAIHTYEKIGFKIDGTLRENVFKNGKYQDELVMSVLRNEWTLPSND